MCIRILLRWLARIYSVYCSIRLVRKVLKKKLQPASVLDEYTGWLYFLGIIVRFFIYLDDLFRRNRIGKEKVEM